VGDEIGDIPIRIPSTPMSSFVAELAAENGYIDYERPVFEVEPDEELGPTVTVRHPAFHKHHFFRLDEEFRFAIRLTTNATVYYSAGTKLDLTACNASVSTSPLCPLWIAKSVEAVTRQFYPNMKFERLSLELE
jgi:hypothetical protein